jgi:GT2 family glycosyltransferase
MRTFYDPFAPRGGGFSEIFMPRVSVIVPIHRGHSTLPASLSTVLAQTLADLEVIVAGDGAPGEAARAALATGDPRVRWAAFPKAPGYGYSNRARALDLARAGRLAYLAPDDLWAPDHLERLVSELERERLDMVFSRPVLVWADGRPRPHYLPFDRARSGPPAPRWLLTCVSPSHVLHTREIHDRAHGWSDRISPHGDVDLWLRMRAAGGRIGYLPRATAIRLPSYAFRRVPEVDFAALHGRLAARLASGQLVLEDLRWPAARRLRGWLEDAVVVGRARAVPWAGALLARARAKVR